ncbi:hypothetical protein [Oscillatoria acuminata]|uniref:Uncharacterized protein n=1 Tax=Oscillatoria acuminata PCC 6304 TaxID=56110 RepID=K9TMV1_9CYAN|nr:hypothetical protein [Oscillatoria acuminata]AFY84192.1 hypothetical protein Oscil6304_4680 [Oscillatoria acuminata PCC 6304]
MQIKANSNRIIVHRRIMPGLDILTPQERKNFWDSVNLLEQFSPDCPFLFPELIQKINTDEPLYVLRVNSSLRATFRMAENDQIEIIDLFPQERIDNYDWKKASLVIEHEKF